MRITGIWTGALLGVAVAWGACGPPGQTGDAGAGGAVDAGAGGDGPGAGADAAGGGGDVGGGGGDASGGTDGGGPACDGAGGYERTLVASGLPAVQVVDMAFDPTGRAFVALKNGTIRVMDGGQLLPEPFVTVPDTSDAWIENGVLGIAFDPDFPASPWVYLFQSYVTTPGGAGVPGQCDALSCPFALEDQPDGTTRVVNAPGDIPVFGNGRQRVIRYDASANVASGPGDFEVLIDELPGCTQTHNGGGLAFGLDGRLFVGLGDATTPPNAQDFSNVAGCILRIDKEDGSAPSDNPFVAADDGIPDVIWACGVRQGFGLAVHPDTGELYQSENGPAYGDELNWIPKGGNLGWPLGAGPQGKDGLTDPVQSWTPTVSPTKLVVYGGALMPELRGDILVGSWNDGDLKRLHLTEGGGPQALAWEGDLIPYVGKPVLVAQDPAGAVYVGEHLAGEIWRVGPVDACVAPQAVVATTPSPASGAGPLTVTLDGSASAFRPPATRIVKYHWELGPEDGHPEGDVVTHTFELPGTLTGMLTVVDDLGRHGQTRFTVTVQLPPGDAPPVAHIASAKPTSGVAPLEVSLVGHGHDPEGALDELRWSFGDGSPDAVTAGAGSGASEERIHTFANPGTYVVTLTAKDTAGQSDAATVTIDVQ